MRSMGMRQCMREFRVTINSISRGWRGSTGERSPSVRSPNAVNWSSVAVAMMFILGLLHEAAGVGSPAANCLRRFIYPIT
ncbi:hypothetical protein G205_10687 [Arthrobacter nitrophenolicus]|uniref:Uncharacterized protein n=1 Tax=Arthrobacter nitrophenolicus TaxID=683150 RepID=L8TSG2_9MICC|nr:hypothetical protein G205_10687 [Arthrobacter nitrophenolicus]